MVRETSICGYMREYEDIFRVNNSSYISCLKIGLVSIEDDHNQDHLLCIITLWLTVY
jgi:hypothetical protein